MRSQEKPSDYVLAFMQTTVYVVGQLLIAVLGLGWFLWQQAHKILISRAK